MCQCAVCTPMALAPIGQVAKMLLIRGLATAAKHRSDDERSAHYEELLDAEQVQCPVIVVCSHLGCSAGKHGIDTWCARMLMMGHAGEDPIMRCGRTAHVCAAV